MPAIKDSYQEFIDTFKINKNDLYDFGLNSVINANHDVAKNQYMELKNKLLSNGSLSIRGYGRGGGNSELFIKLYAVMFSNSNIKIDGTNNAAPGKNIADATGLKKNKDIQNYQISHIWGKTKNPILFESVWNICYVPKLIDPFTGHESKGDWTKEFMPQLERRVFDKYSDIIEDYNNLVSANNVSEKIDTFVAELDSFGMYDTKLLNKFNQDAHSEWELIKRP